MRIKLIFCLAILTTSFASCKKNNVDDWKTIKKLYRTYKNGEISECKLNGQKYFSVGLNGYDSGGFIFDREGNKLGSCNYAWGSADSICGQLKDCEVVYRVQDNIWGQPAVDKYNLRKGLFR